MATPAANRHHSPSGRSIFLSYARGDDEPFVKQIYEDLTASGFDVWLDRVSMPSRGLMFLHEIRDAIDRRDRFLLVIGPKAVASDYVIAEWRHATIIGKAINPILRLGDYAIVPAELRPLDVADFRLDRDYDFRLARLVEQLAEPPAPMGRLIEVPDLPDHLLTRTDLLGGLKDAVLRDLIHPVVLAGAAARVGIHGMGGIGKSVLANLLARDAQVRRAFPDGVIWVSVGIAPDLADLQRNVAALVGGTMLYSEAHDRAKLEKALEDRAVLLVLDDVWDRAQAEAFNVLGTRCRMIVTTRDVGLVESFCGPHWPVDFFSPADCRSLLAKAAHVANTMLPAEADDVISECGRLPLALALCGGMNRRGVAWPDILSRLKTAALESVADRNADNALHASLWAALKVSVDALSLDAQARFIELSVFRGPAPESAVRTLWAHTGALSAFASEDLLISLSERSLVQLNPEPPEVGKAPTRRVSLHDLLNDFARRRGSGAQDLHKQLLAAYRARCPEGWPTGPNDGYFLQNLAAHLNLAGETEQLTSLLEDEAWWRAKSNLDPSLSSYLADIHIGLERAEGCDPPDYPGIVAYSLLAVHAKEQVQDVPLEALTALARLGRWRQALAYVPSIEPPERRLLVFRDVAEILRDFKDGRYDEPSRLVVAEGLRYAEKLDPAHADSAALSIEHSLAALEEKCAADPTTTLLDLHAGADFSPGQRDAFKTGLEKAKLHESRFVLLSARFDAAAQVEDQRLLRFMLPEKVVEANFPRVNDLTPRDYEVSGAKILRQSLNAAKRIDTELVRGLAAELWALAGQPEKALALAAGARGPMNRFPAMAAAAQSFGRAGRLDLVQRVWAMLEDLGTSKYAGVAAERCDIMLRVAHAFFVAGDEKAAKSPMGAALLFAYAPGVIEPSTPDATAQDVMEKFRRRELLEEGTKAFGGNTALASILVEARAQEALLTYGDDGGAKGLGDLIRRDIESASPESWGMMGNEFDRDLSMAYCTLGTVLFRVGNVPGAETAWFRALELAEKIESNHHRARALAMAAEAFARAGWLAPAETFCRQFLLLIEPPQVPRKERERLLRRWSVACVQTGKIEEGIRLAGNADDPANRLAAYASAALALIDAGETDRAREQLRTVLETSCSSAFDVRVAAAMARAVVGYYRLGDNSLADQAEKEAFTRAQGLERESDRLEAMIAIIDALHAEGAWERAIPIITKWEDVATRAVMMAALALSVSDHVGTLEESHFVNLASWPIALAATEMSHTEYHTALVMLLVSEALRVSGKAQALGVSIGFKGDAVQGAANRGMGILGNLIKRDGDLGVLRAYNVFRMATKLETLSPLSYEPNSYHDPWDWARAQRDIEASIVSTSGQFLDLCRIARGEDNHSLWASLARCGRFLATAGATLSTWARIEAVVRARAERHAPLAEHAGAMVELLAHSVKEFRQVAEASAAADFAERHADDDDVSAPPAKGAIVKAARNNDEARILRLLVGGADINETDDEGTTALAQAASLGLEPLVRLLLSRGADPNRDKSTLASAITMDYEAVVQMLIKAGADVNHRAADGDTPLSKAIAFKRFRIAALLLEGGATLNWENEDTATQFFLAVEDDQAEFVDVLIKLGVDINQLLNGLTPLMFAATQASDRVIHALIDAGAAVDAMGIGGATALMAAAIAGKDTSGRILLESGASVDLAKEDGATALLLAAANGASPFVRLLLGRGAMVDKSDATGRTALIAAAAGGQTEVIRLLVDYGAELETSQADGRTALMVAVSAGQVESMRLLLERGADPNHSDCNGATALMVGAGSGRYEVVRTLLERGADIARLTNDGGTVLMFAAQSGHLSTVQLLLDMGADPQVETKDGWAALDFAVANGHEPVAKLLIASMDRPLD